MMMMGIMVLVTMVMLGLLATYFDHLTADQLEQQEEKNKLPSHTHKPLVHLSQPRLAA